MSMSILVLNMWRCPRTNPLVLCRPESGVRRQCPTFDVAPALDILDMVGSWLLVLTTCCNRASRIYQNGSTDSVVEVLRMGNTGGVEMALCLCHGPRRRSRHLLSAASWQTGSSNASWPCHYPDPGQCSPNPSDWPLQTVCDSEAPTKSTVGTKHSSLSRFREWAKEYGPIFSLKLGPSNVVVLCDRRAIHKLLVEKGAIYSDRPETYVGRLLTKGDHLAISQMDSLWREKRKVIAHNFSPKPLDEKHFRVQEAESVSEKNLI